MKILALIVTLTCTAMAQTRTVSVKTVDFPGLQVALATDPSVQALVAAALGNSPAPGIAALLPYSIILQNNTEHTIRAYTLRLSFVDAAGKSGAQNRHYFNLETASNGMEISPGAIRLVTSVISLDATVQKRQIGQTWSGVSEPSARTLSERLQAQVSVVVALDLIVFDTGLIIGPDEGNTLSYLQAYLIGEREAASVVKTELVMRHASLREVSDHLNNVVKQFSAQQSSKSFDGLARADAARRLSRLAGFSQEALFNEVERILAKPAFTLYR